jgi:hypothetical protein
MAKLTLLEMTQDILSSMDSDDVNSISDTEESLQVVDIIHNTYFELMSQRDWPHLKNSCALESVGDTSQPTTLRIPTLVSSIDTIKYDKTVAGDSDKSYKEIRYLDPKDFIDQLLTRNTSDPDITEVNLDSGTPIWIWTDRAPTYWTSFDDEFIVMDAYDSVEESTLQGVKTIVFCVTTPTFTRSDTFIPDLPEKAFPLFLSESKRACHIYLKQQDSPIDAKRALRGMNRIKDKDWRAHSGKKTTNFGRR